MGKKKILVLVLTFIFLAAATSVFGQLTFGIRGGLNLANINMKENDIVEGDFNSFMGLNFGGVVEYAMNCFTIQTGLLFNQNGGTYKETFDDVGYHSEEEVDVKASYLSIPILAKYAKPLNNGMSLYGVLGPYINVLLSGTAEGTFEDDIDEFEIDEDVKDYASSTDFGLIIGAGIQKALANITLFFDIQYKLGLSNCFDNGGDIFVEGTELTVKNSVIAFTAGILFSGNK